MRALKTPPTMYSNFDSNLIWTAINWAFVGAITIECVLPRDLAVIFNLFRCWPSLEGVDSEIFIAQSINACIPSINVYENNRSRFSFAWSVHFDHALLEEIGFKGNRCKNFGLNGRWSPVYGHQTQWEWVRQRWIGWMTRMTQRMTSCLMQISSEWEWQWKSICIVYAINCT